MIDEALKLDGVMGPGRSHSEALKLTLTYLKNAEVNIKNSKYRVIKSSSNAFKNIVSKSSGCLQILAIAGFQHKQGDVSTAFESIYELRHNNRAILTEVILTIVEKMKKKKFSAFQ